MLAEAATSFVYCVAVTGVTGARRDVGTDLPGLIGRLRTRTRAPLAVGFGISTPEQARGVARLADGVIIGSALIDLIARGDDADSACAAVAKLVQGREQRDPPRLRPTTESADERHDPVLVRCAAFSRRHAGRRSLSLARP